MTKLIAEFCQNHKGDRSILAEMIHAAAENGASHGKIQSIWVKDLTKRDHFEQGETFPDGRIKIIKRPYQAEYDRLKTLEVSLADHVWFIDECKKRRLIPLTTIFAKINIPAIVALPWPEKVIKVASYDCASLPFINELKKHFTHFFVSTGGTEDADIEKTAQLLKDRDTTFFHCVTSYPNTLDNCHLARIGYLKTLSPNVGWSDHTLVARDGIKAAKAAMALGATHVERHFTVLSPSETKDGPVSINPALLKELSLFSKKNMKDQLDEVKRTIPEFDLMIGQAKRALSAEELLNRDYYRGRFASIKNDKIIYNWDNESV